MGTGDVVSDSTLPSEAWPAGRKEIQKYETDMGEGRAADIGTQVGWMP